MDNRAKERTLHGASTENTTVRVRKALDGRRRQMADVWPRSAVRIPAIAATSSIGWLPARGRSGTQTTRC